MPSIARPTLRSERGVALVTTMLLLMLTSAILAGFLVTAVGDVRLRAVDRSRTQALYAAHAALEKLTADLGDLFAGDFSPEAADLAAIEAAPPDIEGMTFEAEDGLGYDIGGFVANEDGDPTAVPGTITSGPFQGFTGLLTPYTLTVTSRNALGAESRLQRIMQTVSIPVFQFGVFSETDLTFSANGNFSFGGRVHTNGNLYLAASSSGATGNLYLGDKVTAAGEVIRTHLANTRSVSGSHEGNVFVNRTTGTCTLTSPTATSEVCRYLKPTEGSLETTIGSNPNLPTWTNVFGAYNGYLRNHRNGVTTLNLPLVAEEVGGAPIDLIKRPVAGEIALLRNQRLFAQASIRILLSDTEAAITDISSTTTAPANLNGIAATVGGTPHVSLPYSDYQPAYTAGTTTTPPTVFRPVLARSSRDTSTAVITTHGYRAARDVPLIGGYLKVEYLDDDGNWHDATREWLHDLGFTRRNIDRATQDNSNTSCLEPNPNAILRIQRIRQNPAAYSSNANQLCTTTSTAAQMNAAVANPTDYWPLVLYDIREGYNRDNLSTGATGLYMAGVIHYVDLDVNNLRRWLDGTIGTSGTQVTDDDGDGYVVYFSDRRGNKATNGAEAHTGEFGWEDFVNPASTSGHPNGSPDDGEDVNNNGTWESYGGTAHAPTGSFSNWTAPFTSGATPRTEIQNVNTTNNTAYNMARINPTLFFRRALKLTNGGGASTLPVEGLTIASENPVYVEGHYNATATSWGTNNRPAAILADAITLLSANWSVPRQVGSAWIGHGDTRSLRYPNDPESRVAANTWYRFAALSGKGRNWVQTGTPASFGTDGGVHNFLRYVEDWDGVTINYRGSLASFYFSRQGVGLFRCCANVYKLPSTRNLSFDTNFLTPALLPPKTPMFRDVNTTGFIQVTRR